MNNCEGQYISSFKPAASSTAVSKCDDSLSVDNFWSLDPLLNESNHNKSNLNDTKNKRLLFNYYHPQQQQQQQQKQQPLQNAVKRNPSYNSSKGVSLLDEPISCPINTLPRQQDLISRFSTKQNTTTKILRKLPIHFIDSKDWQMYLEFATIKNTNCSFNSNFIKSSKFKNNKMHRLLNSFHQLYQEYADLFEEYDRLLCSTKIVEHQTNSADSSLSNDLITVNNDTSEKLKSNSSSIFPVVRPAENVRNKTDKHYKTINIASQTSPVLEWCELNEDQLTDLFSQQESPTIKKRVGINLTNKRCYSSSVNDGFHNSTSKLQKKSKLYDHLVRQNFLGQQPVDVIEELQQNHPTIVHKINLIIDKLINVSSDETSQNEVLSTGYIFNSIATAFKCTSNKFNNSNNSNNVSLINIPILLDLLLPKVQLKIKFIFDKCPFLTNPLEIVSELRYFNYNKHITVKYFKHTRQLRGSIKDFFTSTVDNRIKFTILQCLFNKCKEIESEPCCNCGKDILFNDEMVSNKSLSLVPNEDDLFYRSNNSVEQNNLFQNQTVLVDTMSKSTFIEIGMFDNAIEDSFTQTGDYLLKNQELIKEFGKIITKNIGVLRKAIKESKVQIFHLRRQVSSLLKALKNNIDLIISLSGKHFITDQHKGRVILLARQVEELKIKLKEEETKRRAVYNLMQEQMGNVRVYCRCRDIPHNENILEIQDCESIILPILPQERFDFDKVFPSSMNQSNIYEEFQPLVMSFIDGFNVCFITYGSEASGKTYTLIGGNSELEDENGIMQRALNTLLTEQKQRSRDWDYEIGACLVEVYNDCCLDLLSGESGVQLYVDCGMESVYQKLRSVPVTNESDAEVLVQICRAKRKVARTALNPSSSRSHLIILIRLQGRSKIHGESIRSFMCLCDLAGFEDIIKAETQTSKTLSKEAGYINRSLTAFNRVFVSLRRQDPNTVCYRDTKLTHLLKPFLTNSGKCALIITVRTDRRSLSSTQNTLRFGRETRGVTLGKARRQQVTN